MANFLRLLLGICAIPVCCGMTHVLFDGIKQVAGGKLLCAETCSLLGGVVAFVFWWLFMPRLVRTYVLGHELTHALWGLLFGARPTNVRVSASGGSVSLSKTNFLITLSPYFFPFYTFVVAVIAFVVFLFVRPLPCLPAWMFLVGFTWAFHVLFSIETLSERQPDIAAYGRMFSWTFIYIVNLALILTWLTCMTDLTKDEMFAYLVRRVSDTYEVVWVCFVAGTKKMIIAAQKLMALVR